MEDVEIGPKECLAGEGERLAEPFSQPWGRPARGPGFGRFVGGGWGAVPGDGGVWRQRLTGQEYRGKWGYGTGVDQCLELMGMVTTVYAGKVIQEGQAIEGGGVGGEEGR